MIRTWREELLNAPRDRGRALDAQPSFDESSVLAQDAGKACSREPSLTIADAFELSPQPAVVTADGVVLKANLAAVMFFGLRSFRDFIGREVVDFVHPEFVDIVRERLATVVAEGRRIERFEEKLVRADGSVVIAQVTSAPITFEGRPAALTFVRDCSDRREVERALLESEERYRAVFDLSPDPSFVTDGDTITLVNDAACKTLGVSRADLIGADVYDRIPERFHSTLRERTRRLVAGERLPLAEVAVLDLHGEEIPVETSSTMVGSAGGSRLTITVFRDLRPRIRAAEALRCCENRFGTIVDVAPVGMHFFRIETDRSLTFTGGNPAADKICGNASVAVAGMRAEDAFPGLQAGGLLDAYTSVAVSGEPWSGRHVGCESESSGAAINVSVVRIGPNEICAFFHAAR